MIPFSKYSKISNNYCLCYFGRATEYLLQLIYLMPHIKSKLVGLNIYLCCKDEDYHIIQNYELSIKRSQLNELKPNFGYVKELEYEQKHPVENIMRELEIQDWSVEVPKKDIMFNNCFIAKNSHYPTTDLNAKQIELIKQIAIKEGYNITDQAINFDWIIGVESPILFESAKNGIRATLVETGVGTTLFQKMFPFCNTIVLK